MRAGDVRYFDYNEDGDITDADRCECRKSYSDFYGGITSNFSYKGFDLSLFGQFSVGGKVMAAWRGVNGSEGTDHLGLALSNVKVGDRGESVEQFFNISKEVANGYWRGEGTSNSIPRPVRIGVHTGYDYDYNVQTSTRYLEDASLLQTENSHIRIYLAGIHHEENSCELSEILRFRQTTCWLLQNIRVTILKLLSRQSGDSNYGVDFGLQPVLRTFIFGLNLNF